MQLSHLLLLLLNVQVGELCWNVQMLSDAVDLKERRTCRVCSSSSGGGTVSSASAALPPVTFTVQFYQLVVAPCCGPYLIQNCVHIQRYWCQASNMTSGDQGYHIQVISQQGAHRSSVASPGFFLNGVNAPEGCQIQRSVHPQPGCGVRVNFMLGPDYMAMVRRDQVSVRIYLYSSNTGNESTMKSLLKPALNLNYNLDMANTIILCNTTYHVTWEVVTTADGVERTTGRCHFGNVTTTLSRAPTQPRLTLTSVTAWSIDLQWTPALPLLQEDENTGYVVCCREVSSPTRQQQESLAGLHGCITCRSECIWLPGADRNTATLAALSASTLYSVNVTAFYAHSMGTPSNTLVVVTHDLALPAWGNGSVTCTQDGHAGHINISWTEPIWNTQPAHRLHIIVLVSHNTSGLAEMAMVAEGDALELVLPSESKTAELSMAASEDQRRYYVRVTLVTDAGNVSIMGSCALERALPVTSATAQPPPKALSPSTSKQLTEARPTTRLVARRSDSTSVPAALTVSTAASMAGTPDVSSSANSSGTTVDDSGRGGLSPGAIALLAAASALCIAAAVAWFLCYKNRRGQRSGLLGSNRTPMIMLDDEEPLIAMQPDHAEPSAVITENEYTLDPTARVSSS
eukprot:scpid50833/ scgid4430/ 